MTRKYIRMVPRNRRAHPLMSNEVYLELFGMTHEEIFTPEQLQRIEQCVQDTTASDDSKGSSAAEIYARGHLRDLRRQKQKREKQKRRERDKS